MLGEVTIGVQLAGSPPHRKELFEVIFSNSELCHRLVSGGEGTVKGIPAVNPSLVHQAGPSNSHPVPSSKREEQKGGRPDLGAVIAARAAKTNARCPLRGEKGVVWPPLSPILFKELTH